MWRRIELSRTKDWYTWSDAEASKCEGNIEQSEHSDAMYYLQEWVQNPMDSLGIGRIEVELVY